MSIPSSIPSPSALSQYHSVSEFGSIGESGIESVGKDFESVFLSMLVKEMRQSLDQGFFGEETSDTYGGMFDLFIGQSLAQSKPLGIAEMLLDQYRASHPTTGNDEVSASENSPRQTSITA